MTETWAYLVHNTRTEDYELKIDAALTQANNTANLMKQLLAALRLSDDAGRRPQVRSARGAYAPGRVPSRDRLRRSDAVEAAAG